MSITNLISFNISWIGLVYFGDLFIPIATLLLVCHFLFISKFVYFELKFVVTVALIGISVDSLLQAMQVFIFESSDHIPYWLMVLWLCFATTICHCLSFLQHSKWMQLVISGLFAPLSYLFGANLSAVEFGLDRVNVYLLLALIWGGLMVCFFWLKKQLVQEGNYAS